MATTAITTRHPPTRNTSKTAALGDIIALNEGLSQQTNES